MDRLNVGIIGTGWCGGIRAEASAKNGLVDQLHICEIREDRLKEVADLTTPTTATADYKELLKNDDIHAIMISTTPESTHYPIAKEALESGKHVLLEKPIARTLTEAEELITIAEKAAQINRSRQFLHKACCFWVLLIRKKTTANNRHSPNEGIYILRSLNR